MKNRLMYNFNLLGASLLNLFFLLHGQSRAQDLELVIPVEHEAPVNHYRFSEDGKHILSVDRSGLIVLRESQTFRFINSYKHPLLNSEGKKDLERQIIAGLKGNKLYSIDEDKIMIWDIVSGQIISSFNFRNEIKNLPQFLDPINLHFTQNHLYLFLGGERPIYDFNDDYYTVDGPRHVRKRINDMPFRYGYGSIDIIHFKISSEGISVNSNLKKETFGEPVYNCFFLGEQIMILDENEVYDFENKNVLPVELYGPIDSIHYFENKLIIFTSYGDIMLETGKKDIKIIVEGESGEVREYIQANFPDYSPESKVYRTDYVDLIDNDFEGKRLLISKDSIQIYVLDEERQVDKLLNKKLAGSLPLVKTSCTDSTFIRILQLNGRLAYQSFSPSEIPIFKSSEITGDYKIGDLSFPYNDATLYISDENYFEKERREGNTVFSNYFHNWHVYENGIIKDTLLGSTWELPDLINGKTNIRLNGYDEYYDIETSAYERNSNYQLASLDTNGLILAIYGGVMMLVRYGDFEDNFDLKFIQKNNLSTGNQCFALFNNWQKFGGIVLKDKGFYSFQIDPNKGIKEMNTFKLSKALKGDVSSLEILTAAKGQYLFVTYKSGITDIYKIKKSNTSPELNYFLTLTADIDDWIIHNETGVFDGSGFENNQFYFRKGTLTIGFDQLKDRFYQPGFAQRMFQGQKVDIKTSLNQIKIYPKIDLKAPNKNDHKLGISIRNQGGGIGPVIIKVNGKETTSDARGLANARETSEEFEIQYDIKDHPYLKEGVNLIEVQAYNSDEHLISPASKVYYINSRTEESPSPKLYAIIVGTSDYKGTSLDLSYPDKDAEAFSEVLKLASESYLGAENTFIQLLSTAGDLKPSKQNIGEAFRKVSLTAKPQDLLLLYFAGHGTNYEGGSADFYYITTSASSGNISDPIVRENVAISSDEITEWVKSIPALKQVLIFDACHSGQFAEDLMGKRSSKQATELRALERMKDRTGMYILSGSAADAVSYEASIYGQGLLTYSLLFGMKGGSLRDNRYVDVLSLFQFAADKVPDLAREIGGIQKPEIRIPYGGESFDLGMLESIDREKIQLPSPKPIFIRSIFQNQQTFDDNLDLSEELNQQLRDIQANDESIIFVDVARFTNAYSIRGVYSDKNGQITLQANLLKNGSVISNIDLTHPDKVEIIKALKNLIAEAI
ncbi:caspase family protein [Hyphobacterium sp. CCMP332]|nr:caspase family protein [Hyphobacterium sp. CCMP332]